MNKGVTDRRRAGSRPTPSSPLDGGRCAAKQQPPLGLSRFYVFYFLLVTGGWPQGEVGFLGVP
jgi:hypothetical protein